MSLRACILTLALGAGAACITKSAFVVSRPAGWAAAGVSIVVIALLTFTDDGKP